MNVSLSRRRFLQNSALATAGLLATTPMAVAATRRPLRVAVLATEIRKHSHAQHFVDRLLEGYGWEGEHHRPALKLAGLYVDQSPEGDLTQDRCRRHGVARYPTVEEALTLGGSKLAVDGVLLIGEHGKYPRNEKGQTLYPRYAFFKRVIRVFESSGRAVPLFNDKHLSTRWDECVEMVGDAKRLGFPLLAGSSLPVTWRVPDLELPVGVDLTESVCACYGGVDSYDFHGLETAQVMSERRRGGESGVRSVLALKGSALWDELARRDSTGRLLVAALQRSFSMKIPSDRTLAPMTTEWFRSCSPEAIGYFIEHTDGFRTSMFLLNGLVSDFTYAGSLRTGEIRSCQMHLPMPNRLSTIATFFNPLMRRVEDMMLSGRALWPVERTLLTSGLTLTAVESLHQGGRKLESPELAVRYHPSAASFHWRS